eukprot:4039870-Pleurochrysis_carterae.AAC.2
MQPTLLAGEPLHPFRAVLVDIECRVRARFFCTRDRSSLSKASCSRWLRFPALTFASRARLGASSTPPTCAATESTSSGSCRMGMARGCSSEETCSD